MCISKKTIQTACGLFVAIICILLWQSIAEAQWNTAQKLCFPNAIGVPGSLGPPDWWTTPGARRDDPRWRGAVQKTWGNGMAPEATLRGLYKSQSGTDYIYLSFDVHFDPALDENSDILVVTLASTSLQHRLIVYPISDQSSHTAEQYKSASYATRPDESSSWTAAATPAWLSDQTRVWVNAVSGANDWTVQMRIPVNGAGSLNLGTEFGFYASLLVQTPSGSVQHTWPRECPASAPSCQMQIGSIFGGPDFQNGLPPVASWGEGRTSSDPACGQGVSITWSQIGTTNSPASRIRLGTGLTNTFFANPHNGTGTAIAAGQLFARFRLARWGASSPDALWRDIPGGASVASTLPIPAGGTASSNPITHLVQDADWSAADKALLGAHPHQCMLVELGSPLDLDFVNASVVRNMDFETSSTFERDAAIRTSGLGPPSQVGGHRVWVYTEIRNMPQPTLASRLRGAFEALWEWILDLISGGKDPDRKKKFVGWYPGWERSGKNPDSLALEQKWPIYRVHAYYEIGDSVLIGNQKWPVLAVLGSYGYYFRHEGVMTGWHTELSGLEPTGPGEYAATIPADSLAEVVNGVEAEEGNPLLGLLLLVVILVLIVVIRRQFKTAKG